MANIHDDAEREAKAFYVQIGSVSCPELGGELVAFNSMGFRHLVMKRGIRRSKREQRRRFALLPAAVAIVRGAGKLISSQEKEAVHRAYRHKKRVFEFSRARFWKIACEIDGTTVVVVIRQFRGGKKHFLSVYDEKKQKTPFVRELFDMPVSAI